MLRPMRQAVRRDSGAAVIYLLASAAVAVAMGFALFSCRGAAGPPAPCDDVTLAELTVECRAEVRAACARSDAGLVDESCPTLKACDQRIANWLSCHVGDAGAGATDGEGAENKSRNV